MGFIHILNGSNYFLYHRKTERDSRWLSDLSKVSYKKKQQCLGSEALSFPPHLSVCCLTHGLLQECYFQDLCRVPTEFSMLIIFSPLFCQ